jgi:acyl-CoA reductase-like NAD-dependent aldehyde dehydrogenase
MVEDKRMALICFTGSTAVGRIIATRVAARLGKSILELGGNNASIIMDDANLDIAIKGSVFAAAGTCGQRCTSLRRLLVHEKVYDIVLDRIIKAYKTIRIGSPLEAETLCGPLNNPGALKIYEEGLKKAVAQGCVIKYGGKKLDRPGFFVEPTILETPKGAEILGEELFCPILHVVKFSSLEEAI